MFEQSSILLIEYLKTRSSNFQFTLQLIPSTSIHRASRTHCIRPLFEKLTEIFTCIRIPTFQFPTLHLASLNFNDSNVKHYPSVCPSINSTLAIHYYSNLYTYKMTMESPFATDPKTRLTNEPRQSNLSLNEQTEQRKFLPKKSFVSRQPVYAESDTVTKLIYCLENATKT